ncbi:glycoside hydrolase family 16 protein [Algoriphagus sediminis]|uniref:Glycoside hydrolase family 16 protein n=1 Tax=Algoriphagus sediminis TaxID=3057113 RepID=A0ABT7YFC5_9BACT|nr:glycoside hydrolase family 16 protein [Algoriphagus sediminis]MDN3205235.1 glycoside hydrolase family 16 protein [Algoriphagus sediminis]
MKKTKTHIRILSALIIIGISGFIGLNLKQPETSKELTFSGFDTLVWSDEFNSDGPIDPDKWFMQTQLPESGNGSWWGGLLQHYTDKQDNAFVKDGYLNLVAKKEPYEDQGVLKQYTSARLNSKYAFTYGRVEVRAKMPEGYGTWPAIWMLNTNIDEDGAYWDNEGYGTTVWPYCGEIDIVEHWGKNQDVVSSALHNGSSYGDQTKNVGEQKIIGASSEFHVYSFVWTEDKMTFSVDGKQHLEYSPSEKNKNTWPYDDKYYFLMNIALEPNLDPDFVGSSMLVDYIRVYK